MRSTLKAPLRPAEHYKPSGQGTRIYLPQNVYEAALERTERIFHEFPNVFVNVSGGKDSTVVLHLALKVATELKRLPLLIRWVDQEAEWQATVDIIRDWMTRDDVEPRWFQIPFKITNATSQTDKWLMCWDPSREDDWIHPKDPLAIHENTLGIDRFKQIFTAHQIQEYGNTPSACLTGVRAEESPNRRKGLTGGLTYKDITWGARDHRKLPIYVFHPIYDWSYVDVWKCIHDNVLAYNAIYDAQYRYGIPAWEMRVSSIQHETAVRALFVLQEFEPDTYERMVSRLAGVSTFSHLGKTGTDMPRRLPYMFSSWLEYRDYLADNLLDADTRNALRPVFDRQQKQLPPHLMDEMAQIHIASILTNDREAVKISNWWSQPFIGQARKDFQAEQAQSQQEEVATP
jgi:predicted phosphoadenosine phosphosulfate sulfurtransferase